MSCIRTTKRKEMSCTKAGNKQREPKKGRTKYRKNGKETKKGGINCNRKVKNQCKNTCPSVSVWIHLNEILSKD